MYQARLRTATALRMLMLTLAAMVCLTGCRPAALLYYLLLAPEPKIAAEFDKLKDKKVVVHVYATAAARYAYANIEADLRRYVVRELLENVEDIQIADPDEVVRWCMENEGFSLEELGKQFDADYVVYVELQRFAISDPASPQLYRGKAAATIQVADVHQGGDIVWETYVESLYPASRSVPASEISGPKFRQVYVRRLAREIARHFFPYRPEEKFTL